jgi:hypothetical protein
MMVNYFDDFGGAETKEKSWKEYETLGKNSYHHFKFFLISIGIYL